MSKENTDELIKKYMDAETSRGEEEKLFNSIDQHLGISTWFKFIKQQREQVPPGLNDSIWAAIETRKRKKQRFLVGLSAVAASVTLFISLFIFNSSNKHIGYEEKEALLNEALSMLRSEEHISEKQSIIYEDDMIIIYLASN